MSWESKARFLPSYYFGGKMSVPFYIRPNYSSSDSKNYGHFYKHFLSTRTSTKRACVGTISKSPFLKAMIECAESTNHIAIGAEEYLLVLFTQCRSRAANEKRFLFHVTI